MIILHASDRANYNINLVLHTFCFKLTGLIY